MSTVKQIVLAFALIAGLVSGVQAQNSRHATGTASATIRKNDGGCIIVYHPPFFGITNATKIDHSKFSGSAAEIPTNFSGGKASVLAVGEPEFEVNVCISLTSEMVSRDGSGGKLYGGVYLMDSKDRSSNRTSAQTRGYGGEMQFYVSGMSPDASEMGSGSYAGSLDVILNYN